MQANRMPKGLVRSTDIDVLPAERELLRRNDYWVVRSPSNPGHYWGNLLIFDDAPRAGDRERWEAVFWEELGHRDGIKHRTFAWDRTDGEVGDAVAEFGANGYELERTVGLIAKPDGIRRSRHENRDLATVIMGSESDLWDEIAELWLDQNRNDTDPQPVDLYAAYTHTRVAELRALIATGRGAWFAAVDGDRVVGSLGVIVTERRARYQAVDTRASHRGHGIASRLVADAAEHIASTYDVSDLVIAADPDYYAIGLYEKLGFVRVETVTGACRWPQAGSV